MYSKILIPVDLAHAGRLDKALGTAAALAKAFGANVVYAGVTSTVPGGVAHNPAEFAQRLSAFAAEQATAHGIATASHPEAIPDPAVDLDRALLKSVKATGADLVVIGSHIPNIADHVWPSHGGWLATHAAVSVFIVRD